MNNLTTGTFESSIAKGVHLVDFWAPWCGPCRMQNPILDELSKEMPADKVHINKVNVDEEGPLAVRFGIQSIPTLMVFKDGLPVERLMGVQPKQRLQAILTAHMN